MTSEKNLSEKNKAQSTYQKKTVAKRGYRQVMSGVHTWFGLLLGWLLFLIFIMGTASYFNNEITTWMQPEIAASKKTPNAIDSIAKANALLAANYPDATIFFINTPTERSPATTLYVEEKSEKGFKPKIFDANSGALVSARDTKGGLFFYRMHFDLHYMSARTARLIVGFAAMMMLIAIITGIIVHKKIFIDLFTFRWNKGQRSWLDAHNLLSVIPLPFHIMITFTGIITLITLYMPWGIMFSGVDVQSERSELYSYRPASYAKNLSPKPMVDIRTLLAKTEADWQKVDPKYTISSIRINNPNTNAAKIIVDGMKEKQINDNGLFAIYDGVTGEKLKQSVPPPTAVNTHQVMVGLHAGRFGDTTARWLYFFLGLAGTGMIATGLVLWTAKRRIRLKNPEQPHVGFRLVETLNITTIIGLPLAMVSYFWFNRMLPLELTSRADWEIHGFFMVWALCAIPAILLPAKRAWLVLSAVLMMLLLSTPIMNAMTTDRGFFSSIARGDMLFLSFDVFFLISGFASGYLCYALSKKQKKPAKKARKKVQESLA